MIGCVQTHSAYIYDRGGHTRLFRIENISLVRWNRVRDDISDATIFIAMQYCQDQAAMLEKLEPMRHELVVYRGDERVWEGPVTLVTYRPDGVEINARDVMYYVYRTIIRAGYSNAYPNVAFAIDRIMTILAAEVARKEALDPPYNILPHVVAHQTPTDARTSRATLPYELNVWEHIDDIAAKGGVDYTVVGRAIHLWDTHEPLGRTPTVTEADFLGDIYVSAYGSELATQAAVTDGQGNYGTAGQVDPYYGEVEILATAYDETEGGTPPTSSEMASQASRNLSGANPVPVQVRVPDNSQLNPNGVLTMRDLVPGVYMPLRAGLVIRQVVQMQKLQSMRCEETEAGERITIVLFPASGDDTPEEGEE